jgi:hypothetical protein
LGAAAAAADPENKMGAHRLTASRWIFVFAAGLIACGMLAELPARAADSFPYDRELLLDAKPISPAKRMPVLTVSSNGRATLDLWCRTVPALVQVDGQTIKIQTAPLPEGLPQYMSDGQCNERRVQADVDMLAALSQVTEWRKQSGAVVLAGPTMLKFRPSDH